MAKRLVDINDEVLERARVELGCRTIKETVNVALQLVADRRSAHGDAAFEFMAGFAAEDRANAWR